MTWNLKLFWKSRLSSCVCLVCYFLPKKRSELNWFHYFKWAALLLLNYVNYLFLFKWCLNSWDSSRCTLISRIFTLKWDFFLKCSAGHFLALSDKDLQSSGPRQHLNKLIVCVTMLLCHNVTSWRHNVTRCHNNSLSWRHLSLKCWHFAKNSVFSKKYVRTKFGKLKKLSV